ncbi:cell division protein FtsA [Hirschia litorea]|uniref:Cell division protein FtsA n=1 Tax=Hirschia litorea TaxID=1199156 RepID=A0ABW2ILY8_9PROT
MSSLASRITMREKLAGKPPFLAALDIGSSKIACLISKNPEGTKNVHIVGAGHQLSRGVKNGAVTDMDALERSIRVAVEQAERAAGARISDVVLGVSGPNLKSVYLQGGVNVGNREITQMHVRDANNAALSTFQQPDRQILHATPLGYALDGAGGVKDPRGMIATRLTVTMLVVSGPVAPLKNIAQCVTRAHLNPVAVVASPYAAGLSVLVEDEIEQGATVIDMGGGVTSAACFYEGNLIYLDSVPVGGARASSDLAQGLGTTFAAAERLKTLHGAVALSQVHAFDVVDAPRLGEDGRLEAGTTSKAELTNMLRPRFEEMLELLEKRLSKASAQYRPLPRRIVLTGGASQMPGMRDVAEEVFRAPVRMARPSRTTGLGEMYQTSAFSSAAGLLKWEINGGAGAVAPMYGKSRMPLSGGSIFRKATDWLKENF